MNDVRERLREADPLVCEPGLSQSDADRIRRVVVAAAEEHRRVRSLWGRTSWAAAVVAVITIAIGLRAWYESREHGSPRIALETNVAHESQRQVQFVTPGGTRIIWVFNADFKP